MGEGVALLEQDELRVVPPLPSVLPQPQRSYHPSRPAVLPVFRESERPRHYLTPGVSPASAGLCHCQLLSPSRFGYVPLRANEIK